MASGNSSLGAAKTAKNDEFYTQYSDIEAEMNAYVEFNPDVFRDKTILLPCDDPEWSNFTRYFAANFDRFGLKKLISTSYAKGAGNKQLSLFEQESSLYDEELHETHGKLFILERDRDGDGVVDSDDIEFTGYLEGDGDFRSAEVTALRDEADVIITNPPFSLFREFLAWILAGGKQFVILGNMNAITYKEVFPLLKANEVWLGYKSLNCDMYFNVTDEYKEWLLANKKEGSAYKVINGVVMGRLASACWFTNIDHGKRHERLSLMTMAQNLKFNRKLKSWMARCGLDGYPRYDNYDAIEVPFTECIPSDYDGVMGVPITFLDKFCPEQFEIVNANDHRRSESVRKKSHGLIKDNEATITERERESQDNVRARLHQESWQRQAVTDGMSTERGSMHVSSSASYLDMVARPIIGGRRVYRRVFVRRKVR